MLLQKWCAAYEPHACIRKGLFRGGVGDVCCGSITFKGGHRVYLLSIVESTEPKQVYGVKLDFVSERIKDFIIIIKGGQCTSCLF